jgi:hypothetical protein
LLVIVNLATAWAVAGGAAWGFTLLAVFFAMGDAARLTDGLGLAATLETDFRGAAVEAMMSKG